MKRELRFGWAFLSRPWVVAGLLGLVVAWGASPASAQSFEIDWDTIDGGGGTSSGGGFSITGTVGQPDAGRLQGAGFSVIGGFWGIVGVVDTPGAPILRVSHEAGLNQIIVWWTLPDEGWVLEQSPTLGQQPNPWVPISPALYQSDGTRRFITISNPIGTRFYRLSFR